MNESWGQRLTYKQVRDQFNLKVEKRENAQVRGPYGTMGVSADGKCGEKKALWIR